MKKQLIATTRWEYYVANIGGIIAIMGFFVWFLMLAIADKGIDFTSLFFWLALLTLVVLPYALISFFSSMKTVELMANGLIISYIFQKHKNVIQFSEVAEMKSRRSETRTSPRTVRDTFKIILVDGKVFEFERSQFDKYKQLKEACRKKIGK